MFIWLDVLIDKYLDSVSIFIEFRLVCFGFFNFIYGVMFIVMKMVGVIIDFYGLCFIVNDMNCKDFFVDLIYNLE